MSWWSTSTWWIGLMYILVAKLQERPYYPFLKLTLELYNFYIFHCLKLTTCCCKKTTTLSSTKFWKQSLHRLHYNVKFRSQLGPYSPLKDRNERSWIASCKYLDFLEPSKEILHIFVANGAAYLAAKKMKV